MRPDTLVQFCQQIGVKESTLLRADSLNVFSVRADLPAIQLKPIAEDSWRSFAGAAGKSLSLVVGDPVLPAIEIRLGDIRTDMARAVNTIQAATDTYSFHFELTVDKTIVLDELGLERGKYNRLYFLFVRSLIELLKAPLPDLDSQLFTSAYQPTVIVVADVDLYYAGQFLTISGADELARAQASLRPLSSNSRQRVDKYRETAFGNLGWLGFKLNHVTPLHFMCRCEGAEDTRVTSALSDLVFHLSILYTANRSSYEQQGEDGLLRCTYASTDRTVALLLKPGAIPDSVSPYLISRFALWPYSGNESGRLTILQSVVARELSSEDAAQNYQTLIQQLRHVLDEAGWHHRVFVDGQIDKHFEQIRLLNDYIAKITATLSSTLDTISKGVTDTLLATIGFIVATVLAALIKNETQGTIFGIGMKAYAVYLLVFHVGYRMWSIWDGYSLLRQEADEQIAQFTQVLGRQRTEPLLEPLKRRKHQFGTWLAAAIGIYVAVAILLWGLSDPSNLVRAGVISATPIPTPTAVVTRSP